MLSLLTLMLLQTCMISFPLQDIKEDKIEVNRYKTASLHSLKKSTKQQTDTGLEQHEGKKTADIIFRWKVPLRHNLLIIFETSLSNQSDS